MNKRAFKTWFVFLVLVGTPTTYVLLKSPKIEFSASESDRDVLKISESVSTFKLRRGRTACIRADEFCITNDRTLLADGLVVESNATLIPSLLFIGREMNSLLSSVAQEQRLGLQKNIQFQDDREFNKPEHRSTWRCRELRFNHLSIKAPDIQAEAAKLIILPGEIGPFKTALYRRVHARQLTVAVRTENQIQNFQAESASWKFPFGGITLEEGNINTTGHQNAFQQCVLGLPDWSVSSIIPQNQSGPRNTTGRRYSGLQNRLFSP